MAHCARMLAMLLLLTACGESAPAPPESAPAPAPASPIVAIEGPALPGLELVVVDSLGVLKSLRAEVPSPLPADLSLTKVARDHLFFLAFVVDAGAARAPCPNGCTLDWSLRGPAGKRVVTRKAYTTLQPEQFSRTRRFVVPTAVDAKLDDGDPPGAYRFEATLRDAATNEATNAAHVFTLDPTLSATAPADEDDVTRLQRCMAWTTYYYRNPNPKRLPETLACLATSAKAGERSVLLPAVHLVAAATAKAPEILEAVFTRFASLPPAAQAIAANLFWLSENDAGARLLDRARKEWSDERLLRFLAKLAKTERPAPVLERNIGEATDLDNLWSVFFATGAAGPVEKIASLVGGRPDPLVIAAEWSLRSNAAQHERVAEILRALAERSDDKQAAALRKLLPE